MSLEHLFEVEWRSEPEAETVAGPDGREGSHIGDGEGIVKGDKVSGRIRFSFYTGECPYDPGFLAEQGKRFEDIKDHVCTINPGGIIDTDDGAAIQFDVRGFGLRLEKRAPLWSLIRGVRFVTDDERYRSVNELLGVWQGEFDVHRHGPLHDLGAPPQLRKLHTSEKGEATLPVAKDVHSLAEATDRGRPELTETDRRVSLALYRLLGQGQPATLAELAAATELPETEIETRLERWPGVYRDDRGRVMGYWGLSIVEMPPHGIFLDGRKLWAWCAWDTLFLPRRLGATLDVQSRCPSTGREICLRVSAQGVESVEPADAVVSFRAEPPL